MEALKAEFLVHHSLNLMGSFRLFLTNADESIILKISKMLSYHLIKKSLEIDKK